MASAGRNTLHLGARFAAELLTDEEMTSAIPGCVNGVQVRFPVEGSSQVEVFELRPGLTLSTLHMVLVDDFTFDFRADARATIRFVIDGATRWSSLRHELVLDGPHATIFTPKPDTSYQVAVRRDTPQHVLSLRVEPEMLLSDFGFPPHALTGGELPVRYRLNPRLEEIAREALANPFSGARRATYVGAITSTLLCLLGAQLEQIEPGAQARVRAWEEPRLQSARRALAERFRTPPTVPVLAREVGLSEAKLHAGFRALYGETVAGFCRRLRMEAARELLLSQALTVELVAHAVGYSHHSSFTAAFRNHFGHAPGVHLRRDGAA